MTPRRAACDLTIRCDDLVLAGLMGPLSPLTPLPEDFLASTETTPRRYNLRSCEPPFDPEHQAPIVQSQSTERALVPDAMYGSVLSAISIGVIEPSVAALSREASIASQNSSRESSLEPSQASQASTLAVIEEESEFFGREPRIKDEVRALWEAMVVGNTIPATGRRYRDENGEWVAEGSAQMFRFLIREQETSGKSGVDTA